jgi:hypothetical protein
MFYRYRLFEVDRSEAGEAHYAVLIEAGEVIFTGDGRSASSMSCRSRRRGRRSSGYCVSSR